MILHLGAEVSVHSEDIIGIFDYRLTETASFAEYLSFAEWNSKVVFVGEKIKSVVITEGQIYMSPISKATLARRCLGYGTH